MPRISKEPIAISNTAMDQPIASLRQRRKSILVL